MAIGQLVAKAKVAQAKRKAIEVGLQLPESDKAYIVALPRPLGKRAVRDSSIPDKAKQGKLLCEHCAWRSPDRSLLHAHHIIPLACDGHDSLDNIIVLCPTCHALAHYVTSRSNLQRRYSGPKTALELRRWIAAAKQPAKLRALRQGYLHAHVAPLLGAMRA